MKNKIAADINVGQLQGQGPLGDPGNFSNAAQLFNSFLSGVIGIMTIIAGIWFLFLVFTGAIGIISSGGDKAAYESAKKKITTGVIGMAVVVAAIFVVDLVGSLLGLKSILDPAEFISQFSF